MPKNENKSTAEAPAAQGVGYVTVEVLHPIVYEDAEYGRGLHELAPEVAEFFLALRVPNRVTGPQAVARIPGPPEPPKKGVKLEMNLKRAYGNRGN